MKKMKLMCVSLMLLGSVPVGPVWANGGHHGHGHHGHGHHNHGHHHRHHHGGGWGYGGYGAVLGMGLLGYGLGSYFGRPSYYGGYGAGYGYAPAYGYAPVVAAPAVPPPVYVQRQDVVHVQAQPQASNYWHYCRNPEGYYPYVKSCPGGWMQVVPQ